MSEHESGGCTGPTFSIVELACIVVILSLFFAFLLPAVNAAEELQGEPPSLPFLVHFHSAHSWRFVLLFPILSTTAFLSAAAVLRAALPARFRNHLPWVMQKTPKKPPKKPPIYNSRSAITSAILVFGSSCLLIFLASHVRSDRTNRRPVVTWEGPAADWIVPLAILAWSLSALAIVIVVLDSERYYSRWDWLGILAVHLGVINLAGSFMFWIAVYED